MSRKHNVPILTGTQLNGRELELPFTPDERCLAVANHKCVRQIASMIITPLTAKQMDEIEAIFLATYPDLP